MIPRSLSLALGWGMLSVTPVRLGDLPPQLLPIYGGSGGTAFTRDCGAGKVLTGLRGRGGTLVDAIGLLCRPVLSDGTLAPESTVGSLAGGGGGSVQVTRCAGGSVVVGLSIAQGTYINHLSLWCRPWSKTDRNFAAGTADLGGGSIGSFAIGSQSVDEKCASRSQPGSGIRGRAANLVDAIGLVCDEP